jgi:hypothetical protein
MILEDARWGLAPECRAAAEQGREEALILKRAATRLQLSYLVLLSYRELQPIHIF